MIEYKLEGVDKDIHCLFCGKRVGYDENGELGECNHLVYCSSGDESCDIEAYNDLFNNFNEDEELYDYLVKKLDDTHIMINLRQPPPSRESFYIILQDV